MDELALDASARTVAEGVAASILIITRAGRLGRVSRRDIRRFKSASDRLVQIAQKTMECNQLERAMQTTTRRDP